MRTITSVASSCSPSSTTFYFFILLLSVPLVLQSASETPTIMRYSTIVLGASATLGSLAAGPTSLTPRADSCVSTVLCGKAPSSQLLTKFVLQCYVLETAGLQVLRPGTEAYETRDASYFSVSAQLSPNCIVQPEVTAQVAQVVTTLKEMTCKWAVRGGGHMTWAGASNSE